MMDLVTRVVIGCILSIVDVLENQASLGGQSEMVIGHIFQT